MHNIASRYAKALLQLATEKNILEHIQADIHVLKKQFSVNNALFRTLQNPLIKQIEKLALIEDIFGEKVHPFVLKLLRLTIKKRRITLIPAILKHFLAQCGQRQGLVKAAVSTPFPLSEQLSEQLKKNVQQIIPSKEILLEQHIDATLLGGYVLQVGDKRLDQSLRGKLNILKNNYLTEGY